MDEAGFHGALEALEVFGFEGRSLDEDAEVVEVDRARGFVRKYLDVQAFGGELSRVEVFHGVVSGAGAEAGEEEIGGSGGGVFSAAFVGLVRQDLVVADLGGEAFAAKV